MQNKLNKIMWWLLALLPILIQIIGLYTNIDIWGTLGVSDNNLIVTTANEIFGTNGILELCNNKYLFYYIGWLFNCEMAHLIFDMLVLLLRMTHHALDKLNKGGEQ